MKLELIIILSLLTFSLHAQKVEKDSKTYTVKKERIFLDGKDITVELPSELRVSILNEAIAIHERDEALKEQKKIEKALKKAEKEKKKAESELKKKEKLQNNLEKAKKDLKKSQAKYDKLKEKGKLSPLDNQKWLEKLEKLNEKIEKTEKKVKKA